MPKDDFRSLWKDYLRIEEAILYLDQNFREQPTLSEIAGSVNLSEYHFHRLFKRWAGITPKQFLKFLTIEYAKNLLYESHSLLDVTYDSGLSSISRLHDLFVSIDAVTPGEFRKRGKGLTIVHGLHPTPFGKCLLSVTERGICGLSFTTEENLEASLRNLKQEWAGARFVESMDITRDYIDKIFVPAPNGEKPKLNLLLKGTNFQIKVWEALLNIPSDCVLSYRDIAQSVGSADELKAIGETVMKNPIAYIIPCHRVIHRIGVVGPYRWGSVRKKAMLGWEAARREAAVPFMEPGLWIDDAEEFVLRNDD
jgi:AraC family transcriptional regulator of adaptative response/methylated-DNA-[protein]-cysteine methyltransferase